MCFGAVDGVGVTSVHGDVLQNELTERSKSSHNGSTPEQESSRESSIDLREKGRWDSCQHLTSESSGSTGPMTSDFNSRLVFLSKTLRREFDKFVLNTLEKAWLPCFIRLQFSQVSLGSPLFCWITARWLIERRRDMDEPWRQQDEAKRHLFLPYHRGVAVVVCCLWL